MREHINVEGRFQSDKYPTCPPGKVPLSTRDATARDLLWEYAQRRRAVDPEFADDLEVCLKVDGFNDADKRRLVRLSQEALAAIKVALEGHITSARSLSASGGPLAPGVRDELAKIIIEGKNALEELSVNIQLTENAP